MSPADDPREQNRRSWNAATRAHNSHKADQAGFFRGGGSTLFPEELELLGDVSGARLVHLQCNAGQDTLSLARLGARVTGVDISDEAVTFARRLSADSGIAASFERADVYEWLATTGERYDIAFASYGALPWLPDLRSWAAGIARVLRPRGRLALIEFHPAGMMFDEGWRLRYPYSSGGAATTEPRGVGDYVGDSGDGLAPSGFVAGVEGFENPHPCVEFYWSPADAIAALLEAGFVLTAIREYPFANGCRIWERMRELPGRRYAPPDDVPSMPLMYGLAARLDD